MYPNIKLYIKWYKYFYLSLIHTVRFKSYIKPEVYHAGSSITANKNKKQIRATYFIPYNFLIHTSELHFSTSPFLVWLLQKNQSLKISNQKLIRATILGEKRERHWEALSWKLDVNFGSKGNYIGYAIWQLNAPHVELVCPSLPEIICLNKSHSMIWN